MSDLQAFTVKNTGFYKYIIGESCFSIALIFVPLGKGPIFIFWTAYAVLAQNDLDPIKTIWTVQNHFRPIEEQSISRQEHSFLISKSDSFFFSCFSHVRLGR